MNASPRHKRFSWSAAWIALLLHSLALFAFGAMVESDVQYLAWVIWDFPAGALTVFTNAPLERMFHNPSVLLRKTLCAIQFGIFGGAQYFLFVGWYVANRKKHLVTSSDEPVPEASVTEYVTPAPLDNPYTAPNANLSRE